MKKLSLSKTYLVGETGFEPATLCSQNRCTIPIKPKKNEGFAVNGNQFRSPRVNDLRGKCKRRGPLAGGAA